MTEKTLKIEFTEQSKAVTAKVSLEITGDSNNDEVLAEAKRLFDEASKYSAEQTMKKLLRG